MIDNPLLPLSDDFIERVDKLRRERGLLWRDLPNLFLARKGKQKEIRAATVVRIAKALHVNASELISTCMGILSIQHRWLDSNSTCNNNPGVHTCILNSHRRE